MPDHVAALLDWLRARGARFDDLAIEIRADGQRSARAVRPIAEGSEVAHIPLGLLVTPALAATTPLGRAIDDARPRLHTPHSRLAAFLLEQLDDATSAWAPYVRALPQDFRAWPIHWSPIESSLLIGTHAAGVIERQRASIESDWDELIHCVPEMNRWDLDRFRWARLAVSSRVFSIRIDGANTEALVPLADLLDHDRHHGTSWAYDDATHGFSVLALRPHEAGSEVHDSYGDKSNVRFLVNYGFTIEDNPHDQVELVVPLRSLSARASVLYQLIFERPPSANVSVYVSRRFDRDARRLLSLLRLIHADDDELARIPKHRAFVSGRVAPLSRRNERLVLDHLRELGLAAAMRLGGSIDAEEHIVRLRRWPRRVHDALMVRRGEKRVLSRWLTLALLAQPLLTLDDDSLTRAAADPPARGRMFRRYLDDLLGLRQVAEPRLEAPAVV